VISMLGMTTLSKAKALVRKWTPRLGLSDWDVTVRIGDLGTDRDAEVNLEAGRKEAIITVSADHDEDLELLMIHELVHLHFAWAGNDHAEGSGVLEEQAVWAISKALHRKKRGTTPSDQK